MTTEQPVAHWTTVEHNYQQPSALWRRTSRAVCVCGWTSEWYFSGVVAVEEGLAHSGRPTTYRQG